MTFALLTPAAVAQVGEEQSAVSDIRKGLVSWSKAFGGIGELPELETSLPLTDTSIGEILQIETAVALALEGGFTANQELSLTALENALAEAGFLDIVVPPSLPDGPVALSFSVSLAVQGVPVALRYNDDVLRLRGGHITNGVDASVVAGPFRFVYDPDESVDQLRFVQLTDLPAPDCVLVDPGDTCPPVPTIVTIHAENAAGTVTNASGVDGFVDVDLSGNYALDWDLTARMRDPNGRDRLAEEDLLYNSPGDLFFVNRRAGDHRPVAVDLSLAIDVREDLPMTDGSLGIAGAGTIVLTEPDTDNVYGTVKVDAGSDLALLRTITPSEGFLALVTGSAALTTAEAGIDYDLPLLDGTISDLYSPASKVRQLVEEMGGARFTCGATDTSPPIGLPELGEAWFCQAEVTGADPDVAITNVEWSVDNGAKVEASETDATVGTLDTPPTANLRIDDVTAQPRLTLKYSQVRIYESDETLTETVDFTARSGIESAQHLAGILAEHDFNQGALYNPDAEVLMFDLGQDKSSETIWLEPGGAASVGPVLGLRALDGVGDGTTVPVEVVDRSQTLSLGVPLGENKDGPFLVVPNKRQMAIGSITMALEGSLEMRGRIGFLGVDVDVSSLSFASTGDAVTITYPAAAPHIFGSSECAADCPDPVSDVVLLRDVLLDASSLGTEVTAQATSAEPDGQVNVTAQASMAVKATPINGGEDLLPSVTAEPKIDWASLAPDTLPAVTEGLGELGLFDLIPDVTGRITAVDASTSLVQDSQADFLADFGLVETTSEEARYVDRTILNLTGGTSCTGFVVTGSTRLTCTDALAGDSGVEDLTFEAGDRYLIVGDEFALRDRLVDSQVAALNVLDNLDTIDATARFPGLDLRPADLARERDDLASLFETLRGAEAPATLQDYISELGGRLEEVTIANDRLDVTVFSQDINDEMMAALLLQQGDLAFGTTGSVPEPTVTLASSSTSTIGVGVDLSDGSTTALQGTGTVSNLDGGDSSDDQLADALALYGAVDTNILSGSVGFDGLEVTLVSGSDVPLPDLRAELATITDGASRSGATNTCSLDLDPEDEEPALDLDGEICVLIAVKPTGAAAIDAPAIVEYTANASDLRADQNDGEPADLSNEPLRLKFAGEALGYLATGLDEALDGDSNGTRMPLVGGVLDGGAGLAGDTLLIETFRTQLRTALSEVDTSTSDTRKLVDVKNEIKNTVDNKHPGFAAIVELWCDEARTDDSCPDDATFDDVWDISIAGNFSGSGDEELQFASGLPGLPLHSTDEVHVTNLTWTVPVTFGIARDTGPYLEFEDGDEAEIQFEANLPTDPCGQGVPDYGTSYDPLDTERPFNDACIDATMGVFPATLRDIGAGSSLDATTTVELPAKSYSFGHLATDGLPLTPTLSGKGGIEAQFETWAQAAGMFDVAGIIELTWDTDRSDETADGEPLVEVTYSYLRLDKGTFEQMLEPIFGDIDQWLGPIRPVLDEVRRPLPVVSDLSKMVGGDPVTLLSLLVGKGAKTDLIEAVAAFVDFISGTAEPSLRGEELVALGPEPEPGEERTEINFGWSKNKDNIKDAVIEELQQQMDEESCTKAGAPKNCWVPKSDKKDAKADQPKKPKVPLKTSLSLKFGVSVPSITTPILDDSSQIYDLLLGKADAVLIRADFGELSASIGYTATIGPIILGPVPLEVSFGGSITATGRLSLGYDTYAMSQAAATAAADYPGDPIELLASLNQWDTGSVAVAGLFIDDLDATGKDVPEISLTTVIKAGAGVTLVIIKAGIEGGVAMVIEFDVSDAADADHDGKIRIEEITTASCLFDISSYLYFFLQFYLRFDLPWPLPDFGWSFGTKSPKIPLFADTCMPDEPPSLASIVLFENDRNRDDLRINVVGADEKKYVARQLQTHRLELVDVGEEGDARDTLRSPRCQR